MGLDIHAELKTVVYVTGKNFKNPELIWRDLSFFFHASCQDDPVNKEPRLHDAMDWFSIENLPRPIIPVVQHGINCYRHGISYSEFRDV